MSLKVLVVGNASVAPCGIRNFFDMTVEGLRHADPLLGLEVETWDATYDLIYARREACQPTYLPDDAERYDVIHLNWHPIAFNTYGSGHFPWPRGSGPLVSVYLNDIPPWSGCPFISRAEVVVAPEPTDADLILPYPIPDWMEFSPLPAGAPFVIGCSGVREDGFATLRGVCASRGWTLAEKPATTLGWTSPEQEVARLARNSVNVCWYHQARGIAGTPAMALASRRPLLLNHSPMFKPWWDGGPCGSYAGELYLAEGQGGSVEDLEAALLWIARDHREGYFRMPGPRVYEDHGWARGARKLVNCWLQALEAR